MKLVYVPKHKYLFREGDESDFFYGVIQGKISIRKKIVPIDNKNEEFEKNNSNQNGINDNNKQNVAQIEVDENNIRKTRERKRTRTRTRRQVKRFTENKKELDEEELALIRNQEEELFTRGEGYCFGEWGLIYETVRSSSVYTLEDTYFFSIDAEGVKLSILKCLNKTESDRREFIINNLFPFTHLKISMITELVRYVIPIQCHNERIIFKENTPADSIYLVYMGQFNLFKKQYITCDSLDHKLISLRKGSVLGLESIYNNNIYPNHYKHSLRANCQGEVCIILKIALEKIPEIILINMRKKFVPYYKTFLETTQKYYDQKIQYINNSPLGKNKKSTQAIIKDFLYENPEEKNEKIIKDYFAQEVKRKKLCSAKPTKFPRDLHSKKIVKPFSLIKHKNLLNVCNKSIRNDVCDSAFLRDKQIYYSSRKQGIENSNSLTSYKSKQNEFTSKSPSQEYECSNLKRVSSPLFKRSINKVHLYIRGISSAHSQFEENCSKMLQNNFNNIGKINKLQKHIRKAQSSGNFPIIKFTNESLVQYTSDTNNYSKMKKCQSASHLINNNSNNNFDINPNENNNINNNNKNINSKTLRENSVNYKHFSFNSGIFNIPLVSKFVI